MMSAHSLDAADAGSTVKENDPAYGDACPFCTTPVPAAAVVCTGCGARKSTRGAKSGGGSIFLWLMVYGHLWFFGAFALIAPWTGDVRGDMGLRLASTVVGLLILVPGTWLVNKAWRGLFGRSSDPLWLR
jgi:hypothetical protein